jgi:hypothetical protein
MAVFWCLLVAWFRQRSLYSADALGSLLGLMYWPAAIALAIKFFRKSDWNMFVRRSDWGALLVSCLTRLELESVGNYAFASQYR